MLPIIDLNKITVEEIKKTGEYKSTKHVQTYSVDRDLLMQFKSYCKKEKIAVSPIVETLIRTFMQKVKDEENIV